MLEEKEHNYFEYDEWKIFYDPELLSLAIKILYKKIVASKLEFDHIGALGGSGAPLGISLVQEFQKNGSSKKFLQISDPIVGLSSMWLKKIKPPLKDNNRSFLLVDSEVKSGRTLWDGFKKVVDYGRIAGMTVISDYVGFPDRDDYNRTIIKNKIPIIKIFDFYPLVPRLDISP